MVTGGSPTVTDLPQGRGTTGDSSRPSRPRSTDTSSSGGGALDRSASDVGGDGLSRPRCWTGRATTCRACTPGC